VLTSTYAGALVVGDLLYARPNQTTANYYCDPLQVIVNVTGNYTFQSNSSVDLTGFLYNNSFNPANASANVIAYSNDAGTGTPQFQFAIVLNSDVVYLLVVTTFAPNITGSYTITASGPGNATFTFLSIVATTCEHCKNMSFDCSSVLAVILIRPLLKD
jgi:hypothetical protein